MASTGRVKDLELGRNLEVDHMIANLSRPRVAEQFRLWKIVEDQFLKIDEQVWWLFCTW